jgi:hypothetical protein
MANECIPYYADAHQVTFVAGTGGIGGKRFVTNLGPMAQGLGTAGGVATGVIQTTAGGSIVGVGSQDMAAGLAVGVFTAGTVPVTVGATAVVGGTPVMSDTNGNAVPWTTGNQVAGTCLGDTAVGADAPIKIRE